MVNEQKRPYLVRPIEGRSRSLNPGGEDIKVFRVGKNCFSCIRCYYDEGPRKIKFTLIS